MGLNYPLMFQHQKAGRIRLISSLPSYRLRPDAPRPMTNALKIAHFDAKGASSYHASAKPMTDAKSALNACVACKGTWGVPVAPQPAQGILTPIKSSCTGTLKGWAWKPQAYGNRTSMSLGVSPVPARRFLTSGGLEQPWKGVVFMNPPFADASAWTKKARESAIAGATVIGLLPARTGTKWFHTHVAGHADIWLLQGRLKFGDETVPAPFDCMIKGV